MRNALLLMLMCLCGLALPVQARTVTAEWNAVDDSRVGKYVLAWGTSPAASGGVYGKGNVKVNAPTVTAVTPDLADGTWYLAVKACTADESLCSVWSEEVKVTLSTAIPTPGSLKVSVTISGPQ